MNLLAARNLVKMHHVLSQYVIDANVAFFNQVDMETTLGRIRINDNLFLRHFFFHICDEAGAWEGDVVNPNAVFTSAAIPVLVVEPDESMASLRKFVAGIGPVVFTPPPVLPAIVDIEGENVSTVLGGSLEPETNFSRSGVISVNDEF